MGGIADYSGSLVLEMPIAEAAFVSVQASSNGDGRCEPAAGRGMPPAGRHLTADHWSRLFAADYDTARRVLHETPDRVGCLCAWSCACVDRDAGVAMPRGLRILVDYAGTRR